MDATSFEVIREEILKAFGMYGVPKNAYKAFIYFVYCDLEKNPNVDCSKLVEYLQKLKWSTGGLKFFLASWITQFKKSTAIEVPKQSFSGIKKY
jgi:hypothetical protein